MHQMPSHRGGPQTAVELRATHYLQHFGSLQLQSLAIYRLLARLGGKSSVFYLPFSVTCRQFNETLSLEVLVLRRPGTKVQ